MRFYKPSISAWKYSKDKNVPIKGSITNTEKDHTIRENVKFFNWQLSFTKNCVQIAFIIFLISNLFILTIMTINFIINGSVDLYESYTNNVFTMFENVIGGYIIKSATENSLKIVMSVLSDYVEKKYGTKLVEDTIQFIENESCESGMDSDTYNELITNELENANINTDGDQSDDSPIFTTGERLMSLEDSSEEVIK